ncbi:hypothetical protein [Streptomyces ipomoeae]|nr:hypothetical protein [Streptomyces ipomoeae]
MGTDPGSAVALIPGVTASGKSTVAELLAGQLPRTAHPERFGIDPTQA